MAKEKSSKKKHQHQKQKGTKRLGNQSGSNGAALSSSGNKRGNRNGKRGKRPIVSEDTRINITRQKSRGRSGRLRQGNPSSGIRRLGAGIRDARQIINSHQGSRSRRITGRSHTFVNSNHTNGVPPLASSAFNDAVRAAIAPIVAPLLRGVSSSVSSSRPLPSHSQTSTSIPTGPCCLRIANLAQSVTVNDLADLFNGYSGFTGSELEGPGIALVSFSRPDSALSALEEYNNRELDGRTMIMQIDTAGANGTYTRLGPKPPHVVRQVHASPRTVVSASNSRQARADTRWNEIRTNCDM
ncbi:hypothetical protein BV898_10367 [Hypsibius exemplaris]|uniref:RRM domain-containing protein n=1 Tax=Hypsibius exemplaris TaxID=2072580 RepID=A0A1W0WJV9_HYPEX|nr:hypothetical protein BV898_10367 [Hypsibius exemplaris]